MIFTVLHETITQRTGCVFHSHAIKAHNYRAATGVPAFTSLTDTVLEMKKVDDQPMVQPSMQKLAIT